MRKFTDIEKQKLKGNLSQIGKSLGYSRVTISQILHERGKYPIEAKELITKAIAFKLQQINEYEIFIKNLKH